MSAGGGVGSVIAGYLARAGREVVVLDGWKEHVPAIRSGALQVDAVEGPFTVTVDYRFIAALDPSRVSLRVA